jgi:dTDP-4-amino-4,6-dideoxygalactose transaminase
MRMGEEIFVRRRSVRKPRGSPKHALPMPTTSQRRIPIARPLLTDEEKRRVLDVLESGQLTAGPRVQEFERMFSTYLGAAQGVATSSGTAGLVVALEAAGIGRDARVVTTPLSFGATANAILHAGAQPVFADIDPRTFNLDPGAVEDAVAQTPGVRAILPVHLYGLPCRMDALMRIARRHNLIVIEDAAQAHGAVFQGRRVGTFGAMGVFSFYPSKNVTTGEGGMVVTDDAQLAERARLLTNVGQRTRYIYEILGYNYRMTEMSGALGLGQLAHLDERNAQRRRHAALLTAGLQDLPWLVVPQETDGHVYHQYTLRVPRVRDRLSRHLESQGIETRVYYPVPIHRTPLYQRLGYGDARCPVAEQTVEEVLSVPVHPALEEAEVTRIIQAIRQFNPQT